MKIIGLIDCHLDQFHADKYPGWIEQATEGEMKVLYAYGMKDRENGVSNESWCKARGIELKATIEEVVELCDYLIILSPDNPEFHEELAALPLMSGKPTYIDKTFAPNRDAALRLFALAEQHGTSMYSSSALRFAAEYQQAERVGIHSIQSWGPGRYDNYSIHQFEPIVSMMGSNPKRMMCIGTPETPAFIIDYGQGRQATVHHLGRDCPFMLGVSYESGICKVLQAESDFFQAFIRSMVSFFQTGKPAVEPQETIAVITLIEYGYVAAECPYQWVEMPSMP